MSETVTQPSTDVSAEALLDNLTDPQREAVTHADGPLLLLAGAGSGKTRVITRRAAYLAATVTQPWHVLAITFTTKAASEMAERIAQIDADARRDMMVCTFHSLCARLLRIHHEAADLPPNFTIVDQADRREIAKQAIERAELNTQNFRPAAVEGRISRAKNAMQTPEDFEADAIEFYDRTIARLYRIYEDILRENAGLDFDDLLMRTAFLLRDSDDVRAKLNDRYRYVLIDEYQDTNAAQYRIARLLTQSHDNLMVTGDPDQSIYSWRGADIRNILDFEDDYPSAKVIRLEQNYRSTKRILSAASEVIASNIERKEKRLWTENAEGERVCVITCESANDEAKVIAADIRTRIDAGKAPADIAVFYRINALSRTVEETLFRSGIGYRIARGTAFYARKEIKDILAYLRVMVNPADAVCLERIINTPTRGIGKTTINKLKAFAESSGCPLFDAVMRAAECDLGKRAQSSLATFAELLRNLESLVEGAAREALEKVLSLTGLLAQLKQREEAEPEPLANAQELINAAADYDRGNPEGTLLDWLSFTSLLGDEDRVEGADGAVTLMTLHAAKGLEFPVVYIVGLEEGLLPMVRRSEDYDESEEERRLFFVGMTRAKERLTLTHALWRSLHGVGTRTIRSPFLDELPPSEVEWVRSGGSDAGRQRGPATGRLPDDIEFWEVGTLVRHGSRGLGKITNLRRGHARTHVHVLFEDGSDQSYALEFADLERVDYDDIG